MKRLAILAAVAAVVLLSLPAVVLASHYSSANAMGLSSKEFHYLGQTLFNGNSSTPVTFTGSVGTNTFTIINESKTQHIVEFEQISGNNPGYEVESGLIRQNGSTTLTVEHLTAGSLWKVYCPLHDTGKKKMVFYLNVP